MATTFKLLAQAGLDGIAGEETTVFTATATKTQISLISLVLLDNASDFRVHHVASGGALTANLNLIKEIVAVGTYEFGRGLIMHSGDKIMTKNNSGGGITTGAVSVYGVELT
jgi:hypothetical protein